MIPIILLTLLMVTGAPQVQAADGVETPAPEVPAAVRIAVIDDIPVTRAAVAIMTTAYQQLGITMSTYTAPSNRALRLANSGELDGDLFRVESVAADYPNLIPVGYPLLAGFLYAVVLETGADTLPKPEGRPLRVGIRRGVILAEQAAASLNMEPLLADDFRQLRRLLEWGRVDLILVADVEGISPLHNPQWQGLHRISEPVTAFSLYHYVNRRHANLAPALAEVLRAMHDRGNTARILQQARAAQ
ncbi:hypothetical protein [Marinobacter sp. C2H3]|uniref:hypothetical protein n=1 Tax=Marinobacter sp. C2H3 TaxID=3119003 RepID=UPI00300E9E33